MKLLMVNDEVLTVQTMKTDIIWEKYGIDEVFIAFNSEEAKDLMLNQVIDVLLCDIQMPGENGIELVRWIRENCLDIECLFLTCHADFEYAKEAIKLGCLDYILIPAKYEDIGEAILKVVNRIKKVESDIKLQEYGQHWLDERVRQAGQAQGDRRDSSEIVQDAVRYIMEHLGDEELSVQSLAEHLYLHPFYLSRIFKKEKQMNVIQYIISERMKLAAYLIGEKNLNANTVALQVGYSNYPYFNQTFRKFHGCSPSVYKNKGKEAQ